MTTGFGKRSSSLGIGTYSPISRFRARPFEAGFTEVYPMWSVVTLLSAIELT